MELTTSNSATDRAAAPARRRQILLLIGVWVVCTAAMLAFRPGYTFPLTDRMIDSWFYTSYQWDYRTQAAQFGSTYYGSRLSAIVPGAFLHGFLAPDTANLVLKLAVSALMAAGFGIAGLRAGGFRAAALAVALGVACPQIIYFLHYDYIDTYVVLYAAVTLGCVALAEDSARWPVWIYFAGAAMAGMIIANLFSVVAPGLGVVVCALCWLRWRIGRFLAAFGIALTGMATVVVALGAYSVHQGMQFHFLRPQIEAALWLSKLDKNPWAPDDWSWMTAATWLVLPICGLAWGVCRTLVLPPEDAVQRRRLLALTCGLGAALGLTFLYGFRGGMGMLAYSYGASFHLALAVPVLAVAGTSSGNGARVPLWLGVWVVALLVVVLIPQTPGAALFSHFPSLQSIEKAHVLLASACTLLVIATALFTRWLRPQLAERLRPEILVVVLVACSALPTFHQPAVGLRETYLAIHTCFRWITEHYPGDTFLTWEHPLNRDSRSLTSTKLWGYRLFSQKDFPLFEPAEAVRAAERTIIITAPIEQGQAALAEATRVLSPVLKIEGSEVFSAPAIEGLGFDLVAVHVGQPVGTPAVRQADLEGVPALLEMNNDVTTLSVFGMERNFYGPAARKAKALTSAHGIVTFARTDARDHIVTRFVELPASLPHPRQLLMSVTMPTEGNIDVALQDDSYNLPIATTQRKPGQREYLVDLPEKAKSLRLYVASATDAPTALPTRVIVTVVPAKKTKD